MSDTIGNVITVGKVFVADIDAPPVLVEFMNLGVEIDDELCGLLVVGDVLLVGTGETAAPPFPEEDVGVAVTVTVCVEETVCVMVVWESPTILTEMLMYSPMNTTIRLPKILYDTVGNEDRPMRPAGTLTP